MEVTNVNITRDRDLTKKTRVSSIAIIGGSGFVGSSLSKHLSARYNVTVLDRIPPRNFKNFKLCDIRDQRSLARALRGFDLVINTAIIQVPQINANKRAGYEVNVLGTQFICDAVENIESITGLVHASSWHVFGETSIQGVLNEEFGYHPDKIEDRAKFYALCKIAQEAVIRLMGEMSRKSYGIIRLGTVLGDSMPKQTAANVFIENSLAGLPMTPFKHTQHRPMIYVDIRDVCKAFESFANKVCDDQTGRERSAKVVDLFASPPVTIIELARIIRRKLIRLTHGRKSPKIKVIDKGIEPLYSPKDKKLIKVDVSEARKFLGLKKLLSPSRSIEQILKNRLSTVQ